MVLLLYRLQDLGNTFRQHVLHQNTQYYPVTFPSPVAGFFLHVNRDRRKRTYYYMRANTRIVYIEIEAVRRGRLTAL